MNPAIEAGEAIEKAKKLKTRRDAAVAKYVASQDEKLTSALAELEGGLSTDALKIYKDLK